MRLTESLITEFGTDLESLTLVPSLGGIFQVKVDDRVIFSKAEEGRFPQPDEVKTEIRKILA